MSFKIDRIRVQNFRGIRHPLTLTPAGENLIIVGENGSGKSSIVDALEYYFTGRLEKLAGRQGINERQAIPNLAGGPTTIELIFAGQLDGGLTRVYPHRTFAIPDDLQPLFDLTTSRPFILRRAQILEFISARPGERYQQISKLIGLGELDKIDAAWRGKKSDALKQIENLQKDYRATLNALSGLVSQKIETEAQLLPAINKQLGERGLNPITTRLELQRCQEQLQALVQSQSEMVRLEQLRALQAKLEQLNQACAAIVAQHHALREKLQLFWQKSGAMALAPLEKLLTEGHRILQSNREITACPLCAAPIPDVAALLEHLQEQIDSLHTVVRARQEVQDEADQLYERLVVVNNQLGSLHAELSAEGLSVSDLQAIHGQIAAWQDSLKADQWLAEQAQTTAIGVMLGQFQQIVAELVATVQGRVEAQSLSRDTEALFGLQNTLSRVDEQWQRLERINLELGQADHVQAQVASVYDELLAARRRGLQRLTQEIESDIEAFYQIMHPDEQYGRIAIPIHEDRRSSVDLSATYYDQSAAHPLNYFSEGHLDSLGLCIFLAFIKHFNDDLKLIFLDDVLTTVDAGHRLRFARLLAHEFADYQFIITTHDQIWARHLVRAIPHARLIALRSGWTLEQGADSIESPLSDWAFYEEQARSGRCQDAIAGAGRNLEKFLLRMRGNLRLAVPARPNDDYTIGDLYNPFFQWVRRHEIDRPDRLDFNTELNELRQQLDEVWRMRNWAGAHFNEWAASITANEAIGFITVIQRLVDSFACPACGNLVYYNTEAKALLCGICRLAAPTRLAWEYEPGWYQVASKLLQADKPQIRRHVVPMVQSRLRSFLRDMRRRLSLPVMATSDNEYDILHLYHPFFDWVEKRPPSGSVDWEETIQTVKSGLDHYWQGGEWPEIADDQVEHFAETVWRLTTLFECQLCSQLLTYEEVAADYVCLNCSDSGELQSIPAAYWFVK